MTDITTLKPLLRRLKLSGMYDVLELRIMQAMESKWSFSDFIAMLLQDEIERRNQKVQHIRLKQSGLAYDKTLATFDFNEAPGLHPPVIKELATCGFIAKHENIIFAGRSGAGKSHMAQAIGHEAIRRGHTVRFGRTEELLRMVIAGRADNTYERRLRELSSTSVLILDDFGLMPLNGEEQNILYEIIVRRYEKNALIITTNRDIGEWKPVFSIELMSGAAIDRILHHAIRIKVDEESYRLKSFVKKNKEELTKMNG